mmetsp:Transcript_41732/g.133161  ORF Transcript_41732/g.133161 Transcript_41732/m.133161 type:complete len:226 (-) Transcript_41732:699-1376(-)
MHHRHPVPLAVLDPPVAKRLHDPRVHHPLLLEHPRSHVVWGVRGVHGHRALGNDGARVVLLVHEVHRGAREPHALGHHRLVYVPSEHPVPPERRQQRRVDVEHGALVGLDQLLRDHLEVARQEDVVRSGLLAPLHEGIGSDALATLLGHRVLRHGDAVPARVLAAAAGGRVAHHQHDLAVDGSVQALSMDGLEVRPPPRHKDRQLLLAPVGLDVHDTRCWPPGRG